MLVHLPAINFGIEGVRHGPPEFRRRRVKCAEDHLCSCSGLVPPLVYARRSRFDGLLVRRRIVGARHRPFVAFSLAAVLYSLDSFTLIRIERSPTTCLK
jgi:hypothetical protein